MSDGPMVVWARVPGSRVAHAFSEVDLSAGFERVEPFSPCGWFVVAELVRAGHVKRCRLCRLAVARDLAPGRR